jgi:hypothetical protein
MQPELAMARRYIMEMALSLDRAEEFVTVKVTVTKPKSDDFCVTIARYRVPLREPHPGPPHPNEVDIGFFDRVGAPDPQPWRARKVDDEVTRIVGGLASELIGAAVAFGKAVEVELNPQPIPPGRAERM